MMARAFRYFLASLPSQSRWITALLCLVTGI
jgi:hypothetical protein